MFEHVCPSVLVCCITCVPAGLRANASLDVYPFTAVRSNGPMLKEVINLQPQESYFIYQGNIYCMTHVLQWQVLYTKTQNSKSFAKETEILFYCTISKLYLANEFTRIVRDYRSHDVAQ